MDETSIFTVLASIVATLGSSKAWDYYNRQSETRLLQEKLEIEEKNLYRDDLRKEVDKLRTELKEVYLNKESEMKLFQDTIRKLSEDLAEMKVRVEFLERENTNLKESLSHS